VSLRNVLRVLVKELQQLRRDKRMYPILFVAPVLQTLALGYAATTDVKEIPTVVVDRDRSPESRRLLERFSASGYFDFVSSLASVDEVEPWLASGKAQIALVVKEGFGRAVESGRTPEVQILADGSDANSAGIGLGYAGQLTAARSGELLRAELSRLAAGRDSNGPAIGGVGNIRLVPRVWYNPELLSRWYMVPAVLALVLTLVTTTLSSMAIVREKEMGTLEQLIVTPLGAMELVIGKLAPFGLVGLAQVLLVMPVAIYVFGVPLAGSPFLLFSLSGLYLLTTLGLGLLISTLARTQQQAMMGAVFTVMIPMIYLSGTIFPIESMPVAFQYVSRFIPLTYYSIILRGIFLKGAGLADLWPQAAALLAFGVGIASLAALRFRKTLE